MREPLGVIGTVGIPVLVFVVLGRMFGGASRRDGASTCRDLVTVDLPILAAILIALSAVLSLVTIIAIYREGGILKRLRATPLRPHTILTAHVLVKLFFTAVTLAAMMLAGQALLSRPGIDAPFVSFGARAALSHALHPVDRIPDCQPRPDGALRAADRHADPLSDDRPVRIVRADRRRCRQRSG